MDEMESRFMKRIHEEYERYLQSLQSLTPEELIERAEEIAGTRIVYTLLSEHDVEPDSEQIGYLMKFASPLSVITDSFGYINLCSLGEELEHHLWEMEDCGLDEDYELLPAEAENEETEAEP